MHDKVDLLIENGTLVCMNETMDVIDSGWLAIKGSEIVAIGRKGDSLPKETIIVQKIDAKNKLILPGFINTHTHIGMSYFKGIADDLPLDIWLNNHIWPLERKMITSEFVYHSALHGIAELIKNGVTTFNDMYFESEFLAKAAKESGIRAILGEGIMDFPAASHSGAEDYLDYTQKLIDMFKDDELINVAVATHSIYTCSEATLKKAIQLAEKNDAMIHIHLAETEQEYQDSLKNNKKTPTKYLADIGLFEHNVVAAHSVWLSDDDIGVLADKGVNIAINTESNLKLASGFIPLKKCLENGVNLTTATDGVASNNNLSIIEELGTTAKVHKALNSDPSFLPAKTILRFPTINAAKAIRKGDKLGSLEVGKKGDLIMIDTDNIESLPIYDPYSQIVYAQNSSHITDVIINGKIVMFNKQLLTLDEEELKDRARYYSKLMRE
ncbi:MAG: amidohydrolase [Candidatus Cloacimonadia bacterium]